MTEHDDTADTNQRRRAAGRPYFDPDGAYHLGERLAAERDREGGHTAITGAGFLCVGAGAGYGNTTAEITELVNRDIADLDKALRGAGDLFGPGVLAAIIGTASPDPNVYDPNPADRIGRIRSHARLLAEQLEVEGHRATSADAEVARLEAELASAQTAYDTTRRVYAIAAAQAAELTDTTTRLHAYIKTIEAALERVVGTGKANEVRRRARRHAKDVAARG